MAVSTMVGTAKKKKNYAIWYFCLCRSPGNELTGQFAS